MSVVAGMEESCPCKGYLRRREGRRGGTTEEGEPWEVEEEGEKRGLFRFCMIQCEHHSGVTNTPIYSYFYRYFIPSNQLLTFFRCFTFSSSTFFLPINQLLSFVALRFPHPSHHLPIFRYFFFLSFTSSIYVFDIFCYLFPFRYFFASTLPTTQLHFFLQF